MGNTSLLRARSSRVWMDEVAVVIAHTSTPEVVTWLDVSPFCSILGGYYCLICHFTPAITRLSYSPYNAPFSPHLHFSSLFLLSPFSIIHGIFKLGLCTSSSVLNYMNSL